MSDNKDKCMRVDCAAHIKVRKLKTNKCCKLYDDIVVQQTPHHVGPACLFFTTTPTTSIPVAEHEELRDHKRLAIGKLKTQKGIIQAIQEMNHDLKVKTKGYEKGTHALIGIAEHQTLQDRVADLAKPSEEVKRLEDRIVEVELENFNLMVDSFDFVPTNTHLKLVKKCKELEQAKPSECDCCRKPSEEYYFVCPECFKNDHQQEAKPSEGCDGGYCEICNEDQRKECGQ